MDHKNGSKNQPLSHLAGLALLAAAYWLMVRAGLLLVAQPEGVASIWPVSGLALAVLLLNPKRRWSALLAVIFVTNAAGNLSGGNSLPVSLGFALVNTLEPLLAAWVLIYFCGATITFGRAREIFALFGAAIFSNGVTALLGASVPALAFGALFWKTWQLWWTSDGLGMILIAPLIVTWFTSQVFFRSSSPRRLVEATLLILVLAAFSWLLFGPFTVAENPVLRNYMLFPILIWLAFRYSPRGMTSALVLLAVIAIWNILRGYGIFAFADQTVTEHLVALQLFLMVTVFSGLLLSAIITERRQAEENIRELNATLEQHVEERTQELRDAQKQLIHQEKLAMLGRVAGSMGHELRNPLGVISNAAYFLKMVQADAPEKIKEYLNTIEREAHISAKIVADLLDFTRIESTQRESVSIPDLIRQTLERLPAPDSVQVELDLPDNLPASELRAYADPQQVIQVLSNLVLNAYQAVSLTKDGKLTIASDVQGETICIAVQDNGVGISPENAEKIFEPLFTTKTKGIGLGLAVCKKLIEANGGKIEVESDGVPGKGSIFTVWLPIQ